ncbi:MAG: Zn-ribbon domain-containing OB-fold protein [Thermoplasmataceae archaeon]
MGEVSRFWRESVHRYRLMGNQCGNCKRIFFPPRDVCPVCHRESIGKMKDFMLSGSGTIESFSVVHDVPPAFTRQRPYIIAIIRLDDGPAVTGQIVDCDPGEVEMGKRVTSVFRRVAQEGESGIIEYGYKFALA